MSGTLPQGAFDTIANLLKARSGLAIGRDKLYLLDTRLAPILKRHELRDLTALAERLRMPRMDVLAQEVVEAMTTNESLFFRDDKPFEHVRTQALPRLHAARPPGTPLRIWSAASSSGQEAYSLAMTLTDMRATLGDRRVEIIGTDIAREQLARAREGLYSQFEVQRGLPMQMLVKHFRKEANGWRVAEPIRRMVEFREYDRPRDITGPRPNGKKVTILLRNSYRKGNGVPYNAQSCPAISAAATSSRPNSSR
jgi:chemotaxis protein methyltransferase CheR